MMATTLKRQLAAVLATMVFVVLSADMASAAIPSAPTGLTATAVGNGSVTLSWTASSEATDYTIEYSPDAFVLTSNLFYEGVSTTVTATVTGLTNGTSYTFRVKASNGEGTSAASGTVSAVPAGQYSPNDLAVFRACPTGTVAAHGFTDIFHTATSDAVTCIKYYDITKGTTTTTYSPSDSVTRWQMALFLTRMAVPAGVTLGDGSDQGFLDIAGKDDEIQTAVNQLKQLGITVGTNAAGTLFDPDSSVTREEMALFISRLLKNSVTGPGGNEEFVTGSTGTKEIKSLDADHNFTDIESVVLNETRTAVVSLWNLGVTDGTTATTYRPSSVMTRAAMAMFMDSALDHTNARPAGLSMQADTYLAQGSYNFKMSVTNRTAAFLPIAGSLVDTFKYQNTTDVNSSAFKSDGTCAQAVATVVALTACTVDAAERSTDANGNITTFETVLAIGTTWEFWAWTASVGTSYDNDIHATAASSIAVSTY